MSMAPSAQSDANSVVFVVDDDPDVRSGLKLLFESVGLACVTFGSVDDFFQSKPLGDSSCLILDVRMPRMNGLDFQKKLVEARNNIPIIFITGHGDIQMTVQAIKAGAVEFLTKPLREQDVLDAVRQALERDALHRQRQQELLALQARYETLSDREREIMTCVIAGMMNKQTAAKMGLSEGTVKTHRHNLMSKMRVQSLVELIRIADTLGLSA